MFQNFIFLLQKTIRATLLDGHMSSDLHSQVEQGTIAAGDKLFVMPNRVPVEVLNVWLDQDEVAYLVGGENARVKLKVYAQATPSRLVSSQGHFAQPVPVLESLIEPLPYECRLATRGPLPSADKSRACSIRTRSPVRPGLHGLAVI